MATTMAAKEIEALTIASMASRDAVRAMRARGRREGGGRERARDARDEDDANGVFGPLVLNDCMHGNA